MSESDEVEVVGTVNVVKTEFQWKIEQFSSKMSLDVGVDLRSPVFYSLMPNNQKIGWRLGIYPGGEDEVFKDHIGLYLMCRNDINRTVVYSLAAMNENIKKVYKHESDEELFKNCGDYWIYDDFLEKKLIVNEGKNMLPDDTLTIFCEISFPGLDKYSHYDKETITAINYNEELLKNEKFSDVTIHVGSKQILLHRCILSRISPVFQAMFDHDMRENNEKKVEITDIKAEVALEMFRYIYAGKVSNIDTMAAELFEAADKYAVMGLKKLCEKTLLNTLNIDSAFKCLMLAVTYETFDLKHKVMKYILSNLKEFYNKPEYKQLNMECKDEIIKAMAGIKSSRKYCFQRALSHEEFVFIS